MPIWRLIQIRILLFLESLIKRFSALFSNYHWLGHLRAYHFFDFRLRLLIKGCDQLKDIFGCLIIAIEKRGDYTLRTHL